MPVVKIEIDIEDLRGLIAERDLLKARIAALEATPLRFSRQQLSREVSNGMKNLTPDQAERMRDLIENVFV